jgi:hypothetical protein
MESRSESPARERKAGSMTNQQNQGHKMAKIRGASNKRHQARIKLAVSKETPVHGSDHKQEFMVVLDKFRVETLYFELIESLFQDIYPALLEDVDYTAQELCGEELWADLTSGGKREAIFCLRHLARQDDVPLVEVTCADCGTTQFQIIQ